MNRWTSLLAGLLSLTPLAGAARGQEKSATAAQQVAADNNVFALELYAQLSKQDGNLFFSPFSISNALAMTYAGARAKTAEQMAATLHFAEAPGRFHGAFGELIGVLNDPAGKRKYKLHTANALWAQKGYAFLPEFVKINKEAYRAGFAELDFEQTEAARKTINNWVEDKTNDKIKDLITPGVLQPDTRLVLTNAIYFKAAWAEAFQKAATQKADFLTPGGKSTVLMMRQSESMPYMETDVFQLVEIPYESHELSMIVLLPKKGKKLAEVEEALTSTNLATWLAKKQRYQVNLKLPRFKTTAQFSLKDVLSKMGMGLAFSDAADFSGMTSQEKVKIDAVIHKAFVDVNEAGTEAAAATAVIIRPTSIAPVAKTVDFTADHPFVYLIRENRTGSILFAGRLVNP